MIHPSFRCTNSLLGVLSGFLKIMIKKVFKKSGNFAINLIMMRDTLRHYAIKNQN